MAMSVLLVGCEQNDVVSADPISTTLERENLSTVELPGMFLTSRMVNIDNLRLDVRLGTIAIPMQRTGNSYTGQFELPGPGDHQLFIDWFERIGARELHLATVNPIVLNESSGRVLSGPVYLTDQLDADSDGMSNLFERNAGSDPLISLFWRQSD